MNRQPARRSLFHTLLSALTGKAPEQAKQHVQPPRRPAGRDRDAWHTYWDALGQPWRTEPEIDPKRQAELAQRRAITPDVKKGVYPFKGMKLSRVDVEWLLATHEKGRMGLDLRGADLQFVDLSNLPLTKLRGGLFGEEWLRATADQRRMAAIHLEGANLRGSHLERSALSYAHLEGATLWEAHLEGADLYFVHFEGKQLPGKSLQPLPGKRDNSPSTLRSADLRNAFFSAETKLDRMLIGDEKGVGISVEGVRWGDVNLTNVEWISIKMLGDEYEAKQSVDRDGKAKPKDRQERDLDRAVQANRQLAAILRTQGLNEEAARFTYRAQNLQRVLFWRRRKVGACLFSWFLYLIAGYGYKLGRSFLAYLLVISTFMALYLLLDPHLAWYEAIVVSMTAFHGRGFSPSTFSPGDPLSIASAVEAFVGLIIEVTFIATLTRRFFGQ